MDRNEPQPGGQPDLREHRECFAFVVEQSLGHAEQHTHDTVLAAWAAHRAVIAVDHHRAGVQRLLGSICPVLIHRRHLSFPERFLRTVTTGTDTLVRLVGAGAYGHGVQQLSFADVDPLTDLPLADTTFVVVDLETTGGRATASTPGAGDHDAITEIGAVKIRGGVVLGELATLVDPGRSIPPQIVQLTGITSAMVHDAPRIDAVLPAFLEFSRGAVLVAHNAGFDIGFLRAAAQRLGINWPRPPVLCTVRLARRVLTRDEAPSVKLSALARLFSATTTPNHRALDDARATVDVLHGLIERVGNQGVRTYPELRAYLPDATAPQRRKRHLANGVPSRPGVYLFRGPADEVLYIGTAVDLRRRVGQYFTGADPRTRMKEMVALATRVEHVECAHELEAGVRELRLLAAHAPPYNRRSKFPRRWWWITLTDEAFPRFSVVRSPRSPRAIGPFTSRADAVTAVDVLARGTGVRTCTARLARGARHACEERELSPCPAPRGADMAQYAGAPQRAADLLDGVDSSAFGTVLSQIEALAGLHRYESAARLRDHTAAAVETTWRGQRLQALAAVGELIAARPDGRGGWELAVVRHGQLASAGCARRGVPPMPVADAITVAAQAILPQQAPLGGALVEETALITRWLAGPGVRIVRAGGQDAGDPGYASPVGSAARWADWAAAARSARLAAERHDCDSVELDDRYGVHRTRRSRAQAG